MTPDGIEPATFRFVAQHLNRCATAVQPARSNNLKKKNVVGNLVTGQSPLKRKSQSLKHLKTGPLNILGKGKGKVIPLQTRCGPEGG